MNDTTVTDGQAVPPPIHAAIASMIATRYSGQPTQRDLDVANVAAAAERERIIAEARSKATMCPGCDVFAAFVVDLIQARTTP